jgi:carotenoid 1,2-hydratase
VALYGEGGHRWAMTERGRRLATREERRFVIGPSEARLTGDGIEVAIDEWTNPLPRRLRGRIRVRFDRPTASSFALDPAGRHHWWPVAPACRIDVRLDKPGLAWSGSGYSDSNWGAEPLEAGFRRWDWSRRSLGRRTEIDYDMILADGQEHALSLALDPDGVVSARPRPERRTLPRTRWLMPGALSADAAPAEWRCVEDTPFYSRSIGRGGDGSAIFHESLSLTRFASPIVQAMLPFRMPRRT